MEIMRFGAYFGIPVVVFVVLCIAPVDVLDQWVLARSLCEEVWRILPAFKREAIHSTFPQVRQFGACLVVASMPIQTIFNLTALYLNSNNVLIHIRGLKKIDLMKNSFLSIFLIYLFISDFTHKVHASPGRFGRLMETHRFSAAFTDAGILLIFPICAILIVVSVFYLALVFLKKGVSHE